MTEQNPFLNRLETLKPEVWQEIERIISQHHKSLYFDIIWEYSKRKGKYFRPVLFLISLEMYGLQYKPFLPIAAALQLCEDWLLIHDDIEDGSAIRRGLPSLHEKYGTEIALNAGDALHAIMWQSLYSGLAQHKFGNNALLCFNNMLNRTLYGQYLDLSWNRSKAIAPSEQLYNTMVINKTCSYTTTGPIELAARLAGQSLDKLNLIRSWSNLFGLCFQLKDDLLDIDSDTFERKLTWPLVQLWQNSQKSEKQELVKIYTQSNSPVTKNEAFRVSQLMEKYMIKQLVNIDIIQLYEKTIKLFDQYVCNTWGYQDSNVVREAIRFSVTRKY